jgi:hypothetical protein
LAPYLSPKDVLLNKFYAFYWFSDARKIRNIRPNIFFLFTTFLSGSQQLIFLILKLCPDTWRKSGHGYSFFCFWVLNSWILRTWEQCTTNRIYELCGGSIKGKESQLLTLGLQERK